MFSQTERLKEDSNFTVYLPPLHLPYFLINSFEITIFSVRAEQMDKQGLIPDLISWNLNELVGSISNKVCVETIRSNVLTESICVMATLHWSFRNFLKH